MWTFFKWAQEQAKVKLWVLMEQYRNMHVKMSETHRVS